MSVSDSSLASLPSLGPNLSRWTHLAANGTRAGKLSLSAPADITFSGRPGERAANSPPSFVVDAPPPAQLRQLPDGSSGAREPPGRPANFRRRHSTAALAYSSSAAVKRHFRPSQRHQESGWTSGGPGSA